MQLTTEIIESANLSKRQYRLFAVACCNRIKHLITDQRSLNAVDTAEKYADGKATIEELKAVHAAAYTITYTASAYTASAHAAYVAYAACADAVYADAVYAAYAVCVAYAAHATYADERKYQYKLFQDFIQPIDIINPTITENIWQIADSIYESKRFEDLPVLADAMEENGCDNRILEHLRSGGPHVRGCWTLDLILEKK